MPLYSYNHNACGMAQRFFLKEDKDSKVVPCYRCGRNVTAHQVRDKKLKFGEADGVTGVLERDDPAKKGKRTNG